jgi:large subunit ribosomal protein L34e
MVAGKYKSRSLRRKQVRTTSGSKQTYSKRNPKKAKCGECGAKIAGVPRARPVKMKNLPKTKKRPERPYGGFLCSKCMRQKIKQENRI